MRKLGAWLIKAANKISEFFEYLKCKWNKILLFISFKTEGCNNKICTCKKWNQKVSEILYINLLAQLE